MTKRRILLAACVAAALVLAGCKTTDVEDDGATRGTTQQSQQGTGRGGSSSGSSGGSGAGGSAQGSSQGAGRGGSQGTGSGQGATGQSQTGGSGTSGGGSSGAGSSGSGTAGTGTQKDYSADNEALWQSILAARQAALDAGAEDLNPAAFAAAEAEFEAQRAVMENGGSSADLSAALNDLSLRYQGLTALSNAQRKKADIDERDWARYNRTSYDNGAKKVADLTNPLATVTTGKAFFDKAVSAERDFDSVLTTAYRTIANDERKLAFEAKKNADSVKAAVSRKAEYDAAVTSFKNGDTHYVTGNPQMAREDYAQAKESFATLYQEISVARAQAQAAIDAAKQRVSQSEDVAAQADIQAPLSTRVEGIEDEDAQLLEADDFSAAEGAQAEAEDSIGEEFEE